MRINIKTLFILLFFTITAIMFFIYENPMTSYGISIYSQVNLIIWITLITALLCGLFISLWYLEDYNTHWWKLGLFIIIFVNSIIILLPSLIGYKYNIGGDHLTHLGYTLNILQSGVIENNIYPGFHLIMSYISLISNISPEILLNYFGILFYFLFIFYSYILANSLLKKKAVRYAVLCSTVPFFYFYYALFPMGYAFITFILIFYLYFKYNSNKSITLAIILILLTIVMVFLHPVSAFFLLLTFLVYELANMLKNNNIKFNKKMFTISNIKNYRISISFALILFVTFNLWLWNNFKVWSKFVNGIIDLFSNELTTTPITEKAAEGFSALNLSIFEIMKLFFETYGDVFIYGIITIITIILIWKNDALVSKYTKNKGINVFALVFLFLSVLAIIDFVQPLTILSSGRLIFLSIIFLPLFTGLGLSLISEKINTNIIKNKKIVTLVIVGIIYTSSLVGIFDLHFSPITYKTNPAITNANIDGVNWIISNGNKNLQTIRLGIDTLSRYVDESYGIQAVKYPYQNKKFIIPDHFNYNNDLYFGKNLNKDTYMITRANYIIELYKEVFPSVNRFTISDFRSLDNDITVNKIYENGEVENWYINGNSSL